MEAPAGRPQEQRARRKMDVPNRPEKKWAGNAEAAILTHV